MRPRRKAEAKAGPVGMKRVLLVTDFFRPDPGGIEGLFTGIARQWDADSVEVLVTADRRHSLAAPEELHEFDVREKYIIHREQPADGLAMFTRKNGSPSREMARLKLEHFAPDHVLLGDFNKSARAFADAARRLGLPYSIFLNGGDLKNKLGFLRLFERRLALGARNIFAVSRFLARGARNFGIPEDRIHVIPPGFEPRWPPRKKTALPAQLAERIGKKILFLGLGPLVPRKGFDYALEALKRFRQHSSRMHYLIAGSGPEFVYLQELVRIHGLDDMVTLSGFLSDEALQAAYQRADVMLQPGKHREDDVESLGAVFMEAAWFGLPVIAGRLGGVEEIVRHGVSGFVADPGDVEDIVRRIEELGSSEKLRYRFGKNAKEIARKEFDMSRTSYAVAVRL